MKDITERHVQAIWYDDAMRPKRLYDDRGEAVEVLSPGEWNLGAGPDFRHAVLVVGEARRRVSGDVEVHLCPSDWDLHRHGADPAYRNVVAHITWRDGVRPASLPPSAVSIWLGRFVAADPGFSPAQIDVSAYPYARLPLEARPCERRFAARPDDAVQMLAGLGRHRLRMKARRLVGRVLERRPGPSSAVAVRRQVFYEEVMTALGYSANASQFRHVAERIPLAALPSDAEVAKTAMLVAGNFEDWSRRGGRPHNLPERRLALAAELFAQTPIMTWVDNADFSGDACRAMIAEMCATGCLGRGRAAAIIANVIAPWGFAEGRLGDFPDWLPPEDVSSPVRLMANRLFGRDHNPAIYASNGLLIQGMIQLYRELCVSRHPDCASCPVVADELAVR